MGRSSSNYSRREFIKSSAATVLLSNIPSFSETYINTVQGRIKPSGLGKTLIHEHVLVDFIGADKISSDRWEHGQVIKKVLPYLIEIKERGFQSIVECTPAFLGRDVRLLQKLSELSGLQILTNTGYYGASDNKYLPQWAFTETAEQLSARWTSEFENGIEGTNVKPGFIKTGVNSGALSELHQKLIKAAALTHLKTGLTICSHTGPALPAAQEIEILQNAGVSPAAFVWVHANGSYEEMERIGKTGCWISLDGINDENIDKMAALLDHLKAKRLLNQVLISHDAGWYQPGEPDGGKFRGYTSISDKLIPALKQSGFTEKDINQLLITNPANAFAIKIRKH
ncbi:phosphotriesterase [Dyadobacter sp. Leaf189]|uniref:phosphotriesterase family protein n=1 Tax=Dyadobacter sp. Leaf189 TaxID=1736295 RepID=UPI0006F32796|nr:aryldialkylphosphatase [Dyadobacter sp. Leaf189]KQS30808.1 aryldialkylphosphatase [Dyadobacter sp. Leaf189]